MDPVTRKGARKKTAKAGPGGVRAGGVRPFRERRQIAGLTIATIAKRAGLSLLTVQKFELGKRVSPSTENRLREIYLVLPEPMRSREDPKALNAGWLSSQVRTFVREHGLSVQGDHSIVVTMRLQDIVELCRMTLTVGGVRVTEE